MKDDLVVRAETLTVIVTHLQVKQKESENTLTSGVQETIFTGAHINTENVLIITRATPTTETQ